MSGVPKRPASEEWDATWEGSERLHLQATLRTTPAQRLAWLEEAIELAFRAGALPRYPLDSPPKKEQIL